MGIHGGRVARSTLAGAAVLAGAAAPAAAQDRPVYEISQSAAADGKRLAQRLGVGGAGARGLRFLSRTRFGASPPSRPAAAAAQNPVPEEDGRPLTAGRRLDLERFRALRPPSPERSTERFAAVLADLGLRPAASTVVMRSDEMRLIAPGGRTLARRRIDRSIAYVPKLSGLPLVGPGAKIAAAYDGSGALKRATYTLPRLREGAPSALLPTTAVDRTAAVVLEGCGTATVPPRVQRRLVYWAPDPDEAPGARRIVPHVQYRPSTPSEGGGAPTRGFLLPAVAAGPRAAVQATADGSVVRAQVAIRGGRAPYRITWTACGGGLEEGAPASTSVEYTAPPREDPSPYTERLIADVVDADGLRTVARAEVSVTPMPPAMAPPPARAVASGRAAGGPRGRASTSVLDVGVHYVGASQGLKNTYANSVGLIKQTTAAGARTQYFLSTTQFSPSHWQDPALKGGGLDRTFADNVDLAWYTGHAYGDGWTTSSLQNRLVYDSGVRLGDTDLEWLVIAACGPLQLFGDKSTLITTERWGRIFNGLHMLLGYASLSDDSAIEGREFGRYLTGRDGYPRLPVAKAWSWAAYNAQPSGYLYAYMFPVATNGRTNLNDHFTAPTPDIRPVDTAYYLVYLGWT